MRRNLPFLAFGFALLVVATLAGVARAGVALPLPGRLPGEHGALMVAGFFGTLISLERAFAIGKRWAYAVPLLSAAGGAAVVAGAGGGAILVIAGAGFVLLSVYLLRFKLNLATATMGLGGVALLAGNLLWYLKSPTSATPFWGAFLLLIIAGERIELAQLLGAPRRVKHAFIAVVAVYVAGVSATLLDPALGLRVSGGGMLLLAAWLLRYDVAMKSARSSGLPKFAGIALVLGYVWLFAGGAVLLGYAGAYGYDIALHALFLGFVFSMVFGHAPVIFPALLGKEMRFSSSFYVHLALLHLSLLVRLAGNFGSSELVAIGGAMNAAAIFLFLINNALSLRQS